MQNTTDVDRRMLYVNEWTLPTEPHICNNFLQISPRANSQFQIRKLWWSMGTYFTYMTHQYIPTFLASQDIRISMRCLRHQRVDHTRFPAWISGKPRFNISYSNTIWRMARSPNISPITAPVWFSSTHILAWFSDVGDSVRPVRGTAYDDAKSSDAPSWSTVRRSAAAPHLVKDYESTLRLSGRMFHFSYL